MAKFAKKKNKIIESHKILLLYREFGNNIKSYIFFQLTVIILQMTDLMWSKVVKLLWQKIKKKILYWL